MDSQWKLGTWFIWGICIASHRKFLFIGKGIFLKLMFLFFFVFVLFCVFVGGGEGGGVSGGELEGK